MNLTNSTFMPLVPIVLCGGSGTRIWPLSRSLYPKQLLPLVNERSMLQNTLLRLKDLFHEGSPNLICNQEYRFIVAEQLQEAGFQQYKIFLEPEGRNTAPAVSVIALYLTLYSQYQDPLLIVLPADHDIKNIESLKKAIHAASTLAEQGYLVTFGIRPNNPETGYGYIQKGNKLYEGYQVKRFVEKPSLQKAQEYIDAGDYFWNSGMFLFRASVYLDAIKRYAPDIYRCCEHAVKQMTIDLDFYRLNEAFLEAKCESIDYAVMEKADNIAMVSLDADWSDVGSWDVLWQVSEKDRSGNVIRGQVFVDDVSDSYLRAEKRLLAVIGLSNIAVVETPDAVLVADRKNSQNIKSLVNLLKDNQREEIHTHDRVYRPWGYYESLNKNERYQVKHIVVKPGAKLSLQLHQMRSEHWIVIKGTASVTRGEEQLELTENQSIYIPVKVKHRIENNTSSLLHVIEVQTGSYLGEDDIIRFEDVYGRAEPII